MLSVSDDTLDEETGGGSLQIWRMNDLVWRDEEEVVAELEKHRCVASMCAKDCATSVRPSKVAHLLGIQTHIALHGYLATEEYH